MKAKYFPNGFFWEGAKGRNTSQLWKALQENKAGMIQMARWQIGDGEKVPVLDQPWYQGWEITRISAHMRIEVANMKISDLYDHGTQQWRRQLITRVLGPQALYHIEHSIQVPVLNPILEDRLVWMPGKKGEYTVKEGYRRLCEDTQVRVFYSEIKLRALREIWK